MDTMFQNLLNQITRQENLIRQITEKLEQLEIGSGGGGEGNASIADYEGGVFYKRNTLLVDRNTETVYRVLPDNGYTSSGSVDRDVENRDLKIVGFESQIVTIDHNPSQAEIDVLPDDSVVAVYSSLDKPYTPDVITPGG